MKYTSDIENLIHQLHKFPTIGIKTAEKLALYIISKDEDFTKDLTSAISKAHQNTKYCKVCHSLTDTDICKVCNDDRRQNQLMIVETFKEVLQIENSGIFTGKYHVLGGRIEPLNGVFADDLYLTDILDRIDKENFTEIIFGLSTDTDGNATAMYIQRLVKNHFENVTMSQLNTGVPIGSNLEMVDPLTLDRAINYRTKLD